MLSLVALASTCLLVSGCQPSVESRLETIRELEELGRFEESYSELFELVEEGNRDGEVLVRYARALARQGKPGRGFWPLDAAMEDPEWVVRAGHQLALNSCQSGNFELCLQVLERVEAQGSDSFTEFLKARAYIGTRQDYEEALEILDRLLDENPTNDQVLRLRGAALLGLKRPEEAAQVIEEAAELALAGSSSPGQARGRAYWCAVRGRFLRESGEFESARETVDACLEENPASAELLNEAIDLYTALQQPLRVLEIYQAALDAEPTDRSTRLALSGQLSAMGRIAEAETVLREALENAGTPASLSGSWTDLATFLMGTERLPEAIAAFESSIETVDGEASPELFFVYADALILAGRFERALEVAEQTPVEVHSLMIRGRVAFERGEYDEALRVLTEAATAWPNNAPIRYYLARSSEALGDFDRAIEEYRQAIRSDPALSETRVRLVRLHIAENRARHAMSVLKFSSPREQAMPTVDEQLVEIELQILLGRNVDLEQFANGVRGTPVERRADAVAALARGLGQRSGPEAVLESMRTLIESSDGTILDEAVRFGVDAALALDRQDAALELARRGLSAGPGRPKIETAFARALAGREDRWPEARQRFEAILAREPDDVHALVSFARCLSERADLERSVELYTRALEVQPDEQDAALGLAEGLIALGRESEARQRLTAYLTRDAPYDGRAALRLAEMAGASDDTLEQRITLARRALRFGAGEPALRLLSTLAPESSQPAATRS